MRSHALCLLLAALLPASTSAQDAAHTRARHVADSVAAAMLADSIAGVVIGVFRGPERVLTSAYGVADFATRRPLSAEEPLVVGSITKQFTAAAVLALVEEERIGLDAPVTRYLPSLGERFSEVTVRQLLNQTSGIGRYEPVFSFRLPTSVEEVVQAIAAARPEFSPGERFAYNNANYYLLGRVIEQVTGTSYETFLRARFLDRLGMNRTQVCPDSLLPGSAVGHLVGTGRPIARPALPASLIGGAGALCSTAADLARWSHALHGGGVLSARSYRLLITPPQVNGTTTAYAMGTVATQLAGHRELWHNGALTSGWHAMLAYYPDDSLTVVLLTNSFPARPEPAARTIARAWFDSPRANAPPVPKAADTP